MLVDLLRLLRPAQWYKNILVFLALVFSGNLFGLPALLTSTLAFASFCALSSATYIINDYADRHRDRLHPEKRYRPLAAGTVSPRAALFTILFLAGIGLGIAAALPPAFLLCALGYFTLSQLYTLFLKHEAFADIITIAVNFVLRAAAGAFAIATWPSPWLISCTFFLALLLILGKRRAELLLLKTSARAHRPSLRNYTHETTKTLSITATASLIISYTLYVFFGEHPLLFTTLPFALYAIFRFDALVATGHIISRKPEYLIYDWRMLIAIFAWGIITLITLY